MIDPTPEQAVASNPADAVLVSRSGQPHVLTPFLLKTDYTPRGDQPLAIEELVAGIERGAWEK